MSPLGTLLLEALLSAAAGFAVGIAFWAALRPMLRLYLARALGAALGVLLLRLALVAALCCVAAHFGAGPLLGAFAGLLLARPFILSRAAEEPWAARPSKPR